jgi:DNA polymerase I-like protein with 3'-5' exonuclease and polymerase domains
MIGQFHDEVIALVKLGDEATTKATMENSIKKVNEATNLNVPLGIDANFGKDYAEIH